MPHVVVTHSNEPSCTRNASEDEPRAHLRRRRFLQGSSIGAAAIVAGCLGIGGNGNGNGPGATPTGDQIWGTTGQEVHILTDYNSEDWKRTWEDQVLPSYKERFPDTPTNIEYVGSQGPGDQRLATLLQSGQTPESYTAVINQIADLIVQDQLEPVDDVIKQLEEQTGEIRGLADARVGGSAYLIPHGIYNSTLIYRKDIYNELSLEPPETWAEYRENARVIDESDMDIRGCAVPGTRGSGSSSVQWSAGIRNAGGGMFRWKSDAKEEAEVWMAEEHVVPLLEHLSELSQYSIDPSSAGYSNLFSYWASGRIAQTIIVNAWPAEAAYAANKEIAFNTGVTLPPKREGADTLDRGFTIIDGHTIFKDADNSEAAKELFLQMYGSPEKAADKAVLEPMRFVSPYQSVLETDTYKNNEVLKANDGYFLDIQNKLYNDILPQMSSEERPSTPATEYAARFTWDRDILNQVLVQGKTPQSAFEYGREKAKQRLQEGKDRL